MKVLVELFSDILVLSDRKIEKTSNEISFLNTYIVKVLQTVECRYIFDTVLSELVYDFAGV